ncbi:MAG: hypothetical protein U0930_26030 [Pirellulales bacterium]
MGAVTETVNTINSTVRTVAFAVLVGVLGTAGYFGYSTYTANERALKDKEAELDQANGKLVVLQKDVDTLKVDVAEKTKQIEKLETSLHLLKTDQRLARIKVASIERDDVGNAKSCQLEFVELGPNGTAISEPKSIKVPSDMIYVDNWVVKFDDKYVEHGDVERGTSLVLFRRIFGENQQPNEGVSLDQVGMRPQAYARGGALSELEKKLWSEFWEFANNPRKASEMGIRAANGEAISIQVREGMSYDLQLRSSGGMSFKVVEPKP